MGWTFYGRPVRDREATAKRNWESLNIIYSPTVLPGPSPTLNAESESAIRSDSSNLVPDTPYTSIQLAGVATHTIRIQLYSTFRF